LKIIQSQHTIFDLIDSMDRQDIVINKDYQRGVVWPPSAKSYLIDTIIEGYPLPTIYLYTARSKATNRPIKEVVDGQQRLTAIRDFVKGKYALNSASQKYKGLYFEDLDDEVQREIESYSIDASVILSADRSELLEMFRRINAYTASLNAAEKRHAKYQGLFKWFIVDLADKYSPILSNLKIVTEKQASRMADAEFLAELVLVLEQGVVEKKATTIAALYSKYDKEFEFEDEYSSRIAEFFDLILDGFSELHGTFMMKSYVVNTLFAAFVSCKYGLINSDEMSLPEHNSDFSLDFEQVIPLLGAMADAHENKDDTGEYSSYVRSCLSSTTKLSPRKKRLEILSSVLKYGVYPT